jgi:transcriptional regulator with XRE-family HTH domain
VSDNTNRGGRPEIGDRLRAARERAGLSREALAVESKLSWSAIAQVESGRRRNLRPQTLAALAEALGVTIDYLLHGRPAGQAMLDHRALIYDTDDELIDTAVPFLTEGLERSEALLVVTTPPVLGLLRRRLGSDAKRVEFSDAQNWYGTPNDVLSAYEEFVNEKLEAGAPWVRILGEVTWGARPEAEVENWARYESLFNLVFATSPVSVICLYDTRALSAEIVGHARLTHPATIEHELVQASAEYVGPAGLVLEP